MPGAEYLLATTAALIGLGALERWQHRRTLARIPLRIHVNGTRGKSSVTRLIAAALRQSGRPTCAKTTGTLARMILPDGREVPVFRPSGPTVLEQKRVVRNAANWGATALVVECMAVDPRLQAFSEAQLIRASHAVITNARPDHLDEMGPTPRDVALALAGVTPPGGHVFTAERTYLDVFAEVARDRGATLHAVTAEDAAAVSAEVMKRFRHAEHRDNVALALAVCRSVGVSDEVAIEGMVTATPDPGATTIADLDWFGRRLVFVSAFAANDPVSSQSIWETSLAAYPGLATRIAIFNCRADRPGRSVQLAQGFASWPGGARTVVIGSGIDVFARELVRAGFDATRMHLAEGAAPAEIFERVVELGGDSALVVGLGNIGTEGLSLARYFRNRADPRRQAYL